jgi:Tfp pilus assembly protein PilN
MKIDINLAGTSQKGPKDLALGKLRIFSFGALIIIAILSVLLFLINLRFSAAYVRGQQQQIVEELSVHKETSSRIFLLNTRLSDISTILDTRKKYDEISSQIINKVPPSVTISEFEVSGSDLTIALTSVSLLELNNYANTMTDLAKANSISSVVLDSLTTQANSYQMILKIKL